VYTRTAGIVPCDCARHGAGSAGRGPCVRRVARRGQFVIKARLLCAAAQVGAAGMRAAAPGRGPARGGAPVGSARYRGWRLRESVHGAAAGLSRRHDPCSEDLSKHEPVIRRRELERYKRRLVKIRPRRRGQTPMPNDGYVACPPSAWTGSWYAASATYAGYLPPTWLTTTRPACTAATILSRPACRPLGHVECTDVLGGLIHEYRHAA
jgi:hypothetical protein